MARPNPSRRRNPAACCHYRLEQLESRLLLYSDSVSKAIDFVHNVWDLTDLTDDAIVHTLDTRYTGIPEKYSDLIDVITTALSMADQLSNGQYSDAAVTAMNYGLHLAGDYVLEGIGLLGVASVAQLAAWPIEHELWAIADRVNAEALKSQATMYFQARIGGIQPPQFRQYVEAKQVELFDTSNETAWTIYITADGWLRGEDPSGHQRGASPLSKITPLQFYEYEEKQYVVYTRRAEIARESEELKRAFYAAAKPGAPSITSQPQDRTIAAGEPDVSRRSNRIGDNRLPVARRQRRADRRGDGLRIYDFRSRAL